MFYQATADYRIFEKGVPEDGIDEGVRILFIPSASDIIHPFFHQQYRTGRGCVHPLGGASLTPALSLVSFIAFKFAFSSFAVHTR